jgi:hypothetical protein
MHGRRGLFANEALPANSVVAWVPFSTAMCASNCGRSVVGKKVSALKKDDVGFWPNWQLAVWLALESKDENSKWASFIDIMPREYENQLTLTPGGIKSRLKKGGYERLADRAVASAAVSKKMFNNAVKGLGKVGLGQDLSEEELRRALGAVWSRSFSMVNAEELMSSGKKAPASDRFLIPLIDLINHGEGEEANVIVAPPQVLPDTILAFFKRGGFAPPTEKFIPVVTSRDVTEGEELLNNYGHCEDPDDLVLSNLLRRGFVVPSADAGELKQRVVFRGMPAKPVDGDSKPAA